MGSRILSYLAALMFAEGCAAAWSQAKDFPARPVRVVVPVPPGGYTLLINTLSFVVNPALHPKMPFDTARDFAPVSTRKAR